MTRAKAKKLLLILVGLLIVADLVLIAFMGMHGVFSADPSGSSAAATTQSDRRKEPLTEAADPSVPKVAEAPSGGPSSAESSVDAGSVSVSDESNIPFSIPEGVEYDPEVMLVSIPDGMSAFEVESLLLETGVVGTVHINDEDLSSGVVEVEVADGVSLEDAINAVRDDNPELTAQPNYYYHAMLGDEGDLRELLEESAYGSEEVAVDHPEDVSPSDAPAEDEQPVDDEGTPAEEQPGDSDEADAQPEGQPEDEISGEEEPEEQLEPESEEAEKTPEELLEALSVTTNDPLTSEQWALASMRAYEAWAVARCEGSVAVAVLDQYPDVEHEDLAGNVVQYYDVYAGSATMSTTVLHGTHVAGIVSAVADNGVGITGVSYNAPLFVMNVFDRSGSCSTRELVNAYSRIMSLASDHNIRVVNVSIGGRVYSTDFVDDALVNAIAKAYGEYGIVTVAAAGNSTTAPVPYMIYPGDAENVVTVMNLRQAGDGVERSPGSNYNVPGQKTKDISAPGSAIYSTIPANRYGTQSGTSMAAPHVAGVLALEFAANPDLTAAEAVSILYNTAIDLGDEGWDEGYGYGEVDAYAAVLAAKPLSGAQITVSPSRFTYSGSACEPAVSVVIDGEELVQGKDYEVLFANNVNAGTATATVVGKTFYGNASATFTIDPISLNGARVTLSSASLPYTGSAIKPKATVKLNGKTLVSGSDYVVSYKNNVAVGTATVTITGTGNYAGTVSTTFEITTNPCVEYCAHVQNVGWQSWVSDGGLAGTSGQSLRLEAIRMRVPDDIGISGSISYRTHVQNIGWEGTWKKDGALSGTSGRGLRLEALQVKLTGNLASAYDVYYRVHAQNFGWLGWAKNGERAGTAGYSYRLEALQVVLVKKGGAAPGVTSNAFVAKAVGYHTHVQNVGWQDYVYDGASSGTSGRSLRLEGIEIRLGSLGYGGSIRYRTHVQNDGWQGWKSDGAMSGTSGRSLRLEAIQIQLTGEMASRYDVYYRVHCQNFGWMGWAKNGESAGSAGYSYRLEAIQIRLVPKGGAAPGPTTDCFRQR